MGTDYVETEADRIIQMVNANAEVMTTSELNRISDAVTRVRDERTMRVVVDKCAHGEGQAMSGEPVILLTIPEARATARLLRKHGYGSAKR